MCRILVPSSILSGLNNSLASFVTSTGCTCTMCLEVRELHFKSLAIEVSRLPVAILKAEGYMRKEALSKIGHQRNRGALASLISVIMV